ncbi:MAG: hypothetical protein OXF79_02990 [Chloroflexi bacterium]|nr:hypothetical protein [Chloroflexota bacterium]
MSNQDSSDGIAHDLIEIGRDLLVIEVSTIASDSITGRKMPWFPHAVIDILTKYADWLAGVRNVNIVSILNSPAPLTQELFVRISQAHDEKWDSPITNGWRCIEQIRRTAKLLTEDGVMEMVGKKPLNHLETGIATRIRRNCDQLKTIILRFRGMDAWKAYFLNSEALLNIADARVDTASHDGWSEFRPVDVGLTRADISRSLQSTSSISAEKAVLDSDAATRLRKIWELGTDQIIAQTTVHVDGDTVTRFRRGIEEAQRSYYLEIHNQSVQTAVSQWKTLFEAFAELVGGVANRIFGRSS